jgi:hypothetical protein
VGERAEALARRNVKAYTSHKGGQAEGGYISKTAIWKQTPSALDRFLVKPSMTQVKSFQREL